MFGTQAALLPELFGARHRYIGVAFGREISAVIAGGVAPLLGVSIIAWTTRSYGSAIAAWIPLACYVVALSLITIVTTSVMPETRARDLSDLRDAGQRFHPIGAQ
jgi:MHS family metabolite:H+ symporter-like MFS transporter